MKTKAIFSIGAAAAVCLFMTSCSKKSDQHQQQAESVDVARPTVDSVIIYSNYPGTLSADKEVALVARVDGYLREMYYTSGAMVHKGDVLFKLEESNYLDAVHQAEASLATAQANYEYASRRNAAIVEAAKSNAVSEMEVAQAKSNLDQAEAAIKTAKANLQTAQTQLGYCTVRAPFDGQASNNLYSVGAYINGAGAPVTLAKLYDETSMTINFSIGDSDELANIKANLDNGVIDYQKVPMKFAEHLQHDYTAHLSYMDPKVDSTTGTVLIQAKMDNPYGELQSGMFASIDLPIRMVKGAILIRDASIGTDQLGKYVYVVNDSNKVVYTPIKTGALIADTLRVVESGITPQDRYVTKALLKVRDGMTVNPIEQ